MPDALQQPQGRLRILAGRRPGRSHRRLDVPCQDAHASWTDAAGTRAVAAVADGLGSCPLSQHGSQAAVDAAVASLAAEPAWDDGAIVRAFEAARAAIAAEAGRLGATATDLATTLQVAAVGGGRLLAGMVGDGAIVAGSPPQVVLGPATDGYANEVVPVTSAAWREHLHVHAVGLPAPAAPGAADHAMDAGAGDPGAPAPMGPVALFTDGLTRLLLARDRGAWQPFAPFFDAFLPALAAGDDGLVQRFLDGADVDRSWDDDKCLVVLHAL